MKLNYTYKLIFDQQSVT